MLRLPGSEPAWAAAASTVGDSEPMQRLRSQVRRIAPYFRTALITGPPGSGKEGVARMLHALSPGADASFAACDSVTLAESMLRVDGCELLETLGSSDQGGTIFLDDIADVPPALQGVLLRIWSMKTRGRIRVVAGTSRDLRTLGVTGQFRQDLLQCLSGVELTLTPLCERRDDLPEVLAEVLRGVGRDRELILSEEARDLLLAHPWPGDLAEVECVLWEAARHAQDSFVVTAGDLPDLDGAVDISNEEGTGMERLEDVVQQHVLAVLTRCGGNKVRAAEILGISRSTLYRMLESRGGTGLLEYETP
ncbi:sigma-54-dependent transcriptional regulator [Granulicella sibirica]|uniref:Response regulator of zinc sigma-54-dependent two-component system n=1 Tax=Granulicella sibirica TaxID=2479048 RepID=A0A4Q0SZ52_9BACT|nr:sigma 54-interacting transcriptional regulator [Granulicella sibirica]RXH56563.1 Response regulator of zinc sigma-54-dependent two-component system [Granulicella sibirica]